MQTSEEQARQCALLDAGVFIGALLKEDPRHQEARLLVEQAPSWRTGSLYDGWYSERGVRRTDLGKGATSSPSDPGSKCSPLAG